MVIFMASGARLSRHPRARGKLSGRTHPILSPRERESGRERGGESAREGENGSDRERQNEREKAYVLDEALSFSLARSLSRHQIECVVPDSLPLARGWRESRAPDAMKITTQFHKDPSCNGNQLNCTTQF